MCPLGNGISSHYTRSLRSKLNLKSEDFYIPHGSDPADTFKSIKKTIQMSREAA